MNTYLKWYCFFCNIHALNSKVTFSFFRNVSFLLRSHVHLGFHAVWYMMSLCSSIFSVLPYTGFLVNCRDRKSGCMLARRWLFQAVGGVVIHSAASLILLWGGFPCQEAPAWPPAHQPHLAPAYRRPTAHALALRVGGESKLAGLGMDTFWQELLSPHSTEWSADCSAEHKRPEASISSSCGLQACVPLCWLQYLFIFLETVAVFLTVSAMVSQFIHDIRDFCYHFTQSLTLSSSLPSAFSAQDVIQQLVAKAVDRGHQLIQWTSSSVIMKSISDAQMRTNHLFCSLFPLLRLIYDAEKKNTEYCWFRQELFTTLPFEYNKIIIMLSMYY